MRTSLSEIIKKDGIEIKFSISSFKGIDYFINVFVQLYPKIFINHTELFGKISNEKEVIKIFNNNKDVYVSQILKAKQDYDNRRTQRNR
jgi:hypothetical protein